MGQNLISILLVPRPGSCTWGYNLHKRVRMQG